MKEIIEAIAQKHRDIGIDIFAPATIEDIAAFEQQIGFPLPKEFTEFYLTCNGFSCTEDIFNILPLSQIRRYPENYGSNWFYFSEYMIYSDTWGLRHNPSGGYEIFNGHDPSIALTPSLMEFLSRFLTGNVFETDGLHEWYSELGIK